MKPFSNSRELENGQKLPDTFYLPYKPYSNVLENTRIDFNEAVDNSHSIKHLEHGYPIRARVRGDGIWRRW